MELVRTLLSRCTSIFREKKLDTALDQELRSHIAFAMEENLKRGMSPQQARTAALREFGGVTQTKEAYRTQRGLPFLDQLSRDLRFGLRQLYRAPGFAVTAILTLALGLGANTAIFSLVNALLLRPLPVPHAEQLAILLSERSDSPTPNEGFSGPMFRAIEKRHEAFQDVAAYWSAQFQIRGSSGIIEIPGALVSGQFFRALQTPPLLGRYLTPLDDRPASPGGFAVVITDAFWNTWFNRAPNVVGSKLVIANTPFTVVGVMPPQFRGAQLDLHVSIYVPLSSEPIVHAPFSMLASEGAIWLEIFGRRNPGVTLEQANAALRAATGPILTESISDPYLLKSDRDGHFQLVAEPGSRGLGYLGTTFKKPLIVVFCLCAAMLLLACLNLASLLMARAAARERELATRLAIGATRWRLIQQLLIESLLISALGTIAGLALTPTVSRSLAALLLSGYRNSYIDTTLDLPVFLFAAFATLLASVLIGLIPALRATSGDLNEQIKNGSHIRSRRDRRRRLPRILMGSEVALALVLVIGAGLLVASLTRLYRTGLGFVPRGLVQLELDMSKQPLNGDALLRWYQEFGNALSHQPGVQGVSFVTYSPLSGNLEMYSFKTPWSNGSPALQMNDIAPEYFSTMRIPMLEGRDFRWQSAKDSDKEIILNQAAAEVLFPHRRAVGQSISPCRDDIGACHVIAVVGNTRDASIREAARPAGFMAITQSDRKTMSYMALIRVDGAATPFVNAARSLTNRMAPEAPAPVITSMNSILDASITSERMMAMLSVFFAACALLVTAIGLYGTLSYATARRTNEIGIRMALGAKRTQVIALVFRENASAASGGSLAGLAAALLASRALTSFLYGTSIHDPWVLIGSVSTLVLVASAASLIPAVRASRIEPMEALRSE
jgi:predicted permease